MRQLTAFLVITVMTVAGLTGCGAQRPLMVAAPQGQMEAQKMSPAEVKLERIRALVGSWSLAYVNDHYRAGTHGTPTVELNTLTVRAALLGEGYNFTAKIFYKDDANNGHVQVKGHYDYKNRKYSQIEFKELDIDHLAR
jgi:hypothetical protein